MDEMLNIALWIMIVFVTVSGVVVWMNIQPNLPSGLALNGYVQDNTASDISNLADSNCGSFSLGSAIPYSICFINKVTTPVTSMIGWIWNLLTGWTNLVQAIFSPLGLGEGEPGALFVGLLIPFLSIVEVGAVIVLFMRVANIVAQVIP